MRAEPLQGGAADSGIASYEMVPFKDENHAEWAAFVAQCPECWLEHHPDWINAKKDLAIFGEDFSFSIRDRGRIVGVCVLIKRRRGFGSVLAGPGLAVMPSKSASKVRRVGLMKLAADAERNRCHLAMFEFSPVAPAFRACNYFDSPLAQMGFSFGQIGDSLGFEASYCTMVDLTNPLDVIFGQIKKKHSTNVSAFQRSEIYFKYAKGPDSDFRMFDEFVEIQNKTLARNFARGLSRAEIYFLKDMIRRSYMILVNGYEGDICVASTLFSTYKEAAWYYAGGSTERGLIIGGAIFCIYSAMKILKGQGFTVLCVGETSPMQTGKDEGVGFFKRRFANKRTDYLKGVFLFDRRKYFRDILVPTALMASGFVPTPIRWLARKLRG